MTQLIPATEGVVEPEKISPEGLEIANSYLVTHSLTLTAQELGVTKDIIVQHVNNPLVQNYISAVYMDSGFRNRHTLASTLDDVINKKLEEMEEAEISSSKDISELLTLAHKMRMDELKLDLERLKLEASLKKSTVVNTGPTVNIQDNSTQGSNYGSLINRILEAKN